MPEISVIIPTYSRPVFLERAIKSVLNQTYKDFEIIVVDDNNQEDIYRKKTERVMSKFVINKSVRYIQHKKNLNGSAARNTGIKHAKGKYIAFLDDDDEWVPEKLEDQVKVIQSLPKEFGVVYGGIQYYSEKTNETVRTMLPKHSGNIHPQMLNQCTIFIPASLVKVECFKTAGLFDESLRSCQDWDMWIRISKLFQIYSIPKIHAIVHVHGQQVSGQLLYRLNGRKKIYNKYLPEYEKYPNVNSHFLERIGVLYCLNKERKEGSHYFKMSISKKRTRLRPYIHLLLSSLLPIFHLKLLKKFSVSKYLGVTFYH